jgi:hypothetical protein
MVRALIVQALHDLIQLIRLCSLSAAVRTSEGRGWGGEGDGSCWVRRGRQEGQVNNAVGWDGGLLRGRGECESCRGRVGVCMRVAALLNICIGMAMALCSDRSRHRIASSYPCNHTFFKLVCDFCLLANACIYLIAPCSRARARVRRARRALARTASDVVARADACAAGWAGREGRCSVDRCSCVIHAHANLVGNRRAQRLEVTRARASTAC